MVHLCVSISDDGPRLESVQKELPTPARDSKKRAMDMATLRHQPRSRKASSRQDRGSCSSTASCPVFSGPYSDQEDNPPIRRRSSPILQDSFSKLHNCTSPNGSLPSLQGSEPSLQGSPPTLQGSLLSLNGSLPSLRGSLTSLQGSLPGLQGSLPTLKGSLSGFQGSIARLKGSISGFKRRSLGSLDNPSSKHTEGSSSPSLRSASSSEDDGSWDTNSWSSGVTCLLRTPVKQQSNEGLPAPSSSSGKTNSDKTPTYFVEEPEIIYQNLTFSRPAPTAVRKGVFASQSTPSISASRRETGAQRASSSSQGTNAATSATHQWGQKAEDKLKFSQFLNEVTCRVLKSRASEPHHRSNIRHRYPSPPPPPPPSTPPPLPPPPPPPPPAGMWRSPTCSNLKTIKESGSRDLGSSIHRWSQSLPSCKILEPTDVLKKVKGESYSYPERDLALCTKIQAQPSTGRFYLETDIDRVRRLDELVANGTLGRGRKEKATEKGIHIGKERECGRDYPWERSGRKMEREKPKENPSKGERGIEKETRKDKVTERPWERDKEMERGRGKEKRVVHASREPPPASTAAPAGRRSPCREFRWPDGFPSTSYRSASLPRPVVNTESGGGMRHDTSSFHDHKDDLRKRLSYTTHKLEMVETEFDSTRQYLETELRRAQEELEKFTDKLRRIQSSYAALQRINQDLEDKMHRTSQHYEEEKRAFSREIIVLNNHLVEAKITIDKLREDNELYRKDCNLAAQLLQCSKSQYRSHKMSELPLDFQERVSSHMEKHNRGSGASMSMCHSTYSDSIPTSIIAKVLEKPEPGSGCPVARSPSPQAQDGDFQSGTGSTDQLNRRTAYKTSDLYCSDTALYCPERWQATERRQSVDLNGTRLLQLHTQNSTDSNPDEEAYHSGSFSHHEAPSSFHQHEFGTGSLPASSSYSSFSIASDEKGGVGGGCGRTASSTLSSSHQALYMDWRDGSSGDYERKGMSSYEKNNMSFPKSQSIQHMAPTRSPQRGNSPAYTRTASCFSEPYHSSSPRLATSHSMGSTLGLAQAHSGGAESTGSIHVPEDELSSRWRQLSVEDMNTFSSSYRDITGRISPYSFSERHFAMGPSSKVKVGPLYSSFQEGDDVFHSLVLDRSFAVGSPSPNRNTSPSAKHSGVGHHKKEKAPVLYRATDSQDSECSLFFSGSSKEEGATAGSGSKKDYVNLSADSSTESLRQSSLEASSLQHYPCPRPSSRPRPSSSSALNIGPALPKKTSPRYQKFGSTGLTRKDSLTKAQLYGTLLN